jgi:hypothetical protein
MTNFDILDKMIDDLKNDELNKSKKVWIVNNNNIEEAKAFCKKYGHTLKKVRIKGYYREIPIAEIIP